MRWCRLTTPERIEDALLLLQRDPSADISHVERNAEFGSRFDAHPQYDIPRVAELHRVGEHVDQNLADLPYVGEELHRLVRPVDLQPEPFLVSDWLNEQEGLLQDVRQERGLGPDDFLACLD